jgi:HlyD family secretion protein
MDLLEGKPAYSPFRPGMTATLILLLKQKKNISAAKCRVVVKSDTAAVSDVKETLG